MRYEDREKPPNVKVLPSKQGAEFDTWSLLSPAPGRWHDDLERRKFSRLRTFSRLDMGEFQSREREGERERERGGGYMLRINLRFINKNRGIHGKILPVEN